MDSQSRYEMVRVKYVDFPCRACEQRRNNRKELWEDVLRVLRFLLILIPIAYWLIFKAG